MILQPKPNISISLIANLVVAWLAPFGMAVRLLRLGLAVFIALPRLLWGFLMSEYDSSAELYRLRREFDEEPELGLDWREKVFSGEVEVPDEGFAFDKDFFLVAHGVVKDSNCGKFKRFNGCLRSHLHDGITTLDGVSYKNMGYFKPVWWSCNRPECPKCGVSGWAVRLAGRVEAILKFASLKHGKVEHIILSPPQNLGLGLEELRALARKALLVRGVVGGCMVYHHFRYRNRRVADYTGLPIGWFKAPHFHVLGFIKGGYGNCRTCRFQLDKTFMKCREDGGCNGFEAVTRRANVKDGFIAKVKGERKTIGGTVWYELSHASLKRGVVKQNVVTWFGVCNRHELKVPKGSLPQKENLCEICGLELYKVSYHGDFKEMMVFLEFSKRSKGHVLPLKDKDGKLLWTAVHEEKYKGG
jgi:hypothetical protein